MKQIIRAFSLGLLTATLLLFVVYQIKTEKPKHELPLEGVSIEEASKLLKTKGYVLLSESEFHELITASEQKSDLEKEKTKSDDEKTVQEEKESIEEKENPTVIEYTLTIAPGMNSIDIADTLEEANIIDNSEEFQQFLEENGYSTFIQIGDFTLHNQMSLDEIAKIITKSN
jgi:hypothetical protein